MMMMQDDAWARSLMPCVVHGERNDATDECAYSFTFESGFVRVYSLDWAPIERNKQKEREREK